MAQSSYSTALEAAIANLTAVIKAELKDEVRQELVAEFAGLAGGKLPPKAAKKTASKAAPKAATPKAPASPLKVQEGKRRTEADIEAAADKLLGWFKANPNSRIDQAAKALEVTVADLALPLEKLRKGKKVSKKGKLRGTTYAASGGKPAAKSKS